MKKSLIMCVLSAAVISTASFAQTSFTPPSYGAATYSSIKDDDVSLGAIGVKIGAFANENASFELRGQFGAKDDTIHSSGITIDIEVDTVFGAYGRFGGFLTPTVYPYAILGYTMLDYNVKGTDGTSSASFDGDFSSASFGFGVDIYANKTTAINLEYMRLIDDQDAKLKALTIGASFSF
jgi:hypothetical protein